MDVLRKAFNQQLDQKISDFVSSVEDDEALIEADLKGSLAHAAMLNQCGLISPSDYKQIKDGLEQILQEAKSGTFKLKAVHEDVHMNVEKRLQEIIGEAALRLHTARSRNDQVALDLRIYVIERIEVIVALLEALQLRLIEVAEKNFTTVMPGYTHVQRAQPILFAHALLAFFEAFNRDRQRFQQAAVRTKVSPLGAGAQAGTSLPVDPKYTAKLLEFPEVFANSVDAVSDRDFVADFLFAASLTATHLSQMAETLIIWSTKEFGFIEFSDAVTTTSSLMPQKKNIDPLEIVRGKTGSIYGELIALLVTLKGLPLGYNRDLQETKPPVIHASETLEASLEATLVVIANMEVKAAATLDAASDPEMMSTDLVEYLVRQGVPFRKAHDTLSEVIKYSRENGKKLSALTLEEMKHFAPEFEEDVFALYDAKKSADEKTSHGGTSSANVTKAMESHRRNLK
jgi:argininosuccinate lyase